MPPPSYSPETMPRLLLARSALALALGFVDMVITDRRNGFEGVVPAALRNAWDALTEEIGDGQWAPDSDRWPVRGARESRP